MAEEHRTHDPPTETTRSQTGTAQLETFIPQEGGGANDRGVRTTTVRSKFTRDHILIIWCEFISLLITFLQIRPEKLVIFQTNKLEEFPGRAG